MALTLVLGACVGEKPDPPRPGTRDKVVVAFIGPLTGEGSEIGGYVLDGVKLAIEQADEQGDLDVEIVLELFDSGGSAAQAGRLGNLLVSRSEVLGVVGPVTSEGAKRFLAELAGRKLPMVSPSAGDPDLPGELEVGLFRRLVIDRAGFDAYLSDYLSTVLKPKKVAYVSDGTTEGDESVKSVIDLLEAQDIETGGFVTASAEELDLSVDVVLSSESDAIFFGGNPGRAGRFASALRTKAYAGMFIGIEKTMDQGFIDSSEEIGAEGAQMLCACKLATSDSPGDLGVFASDFSDAFDREPGVYSAEGFDAASLFISAVEAGHRTRSSVIGFFEDLEEFQGITKLMMFDEDGNLTDGEAFVFEVRGGRFQLVGTVSELLI